MDIPASSALMERLLQDDLFSTNSGEVDIEFFVKRLRTTAEELLPALENLTLRGALTAATLWRCAECGAASSLTDYSCHVCAFPRPSNPPQLRVFVRSTKYHERDPAAVFLIHGMNTLGAWQESFAWRIQLLYRVSLPVFVFKYGRDLFSPLTQLSQRQRTSELGSALRAAQADLRRAGRSTRCDVIAHSFGTLLIARLLSDPANADLSFGRVILCGSIVHRDVAWHSFIASGRIEGVLNHCGGRDIWVRRAPWFFPGVGSSGYDGFEDTRETGELFSPTYEHSDFFAQASFEETIRDKWAAFLAGQNFAPASCLSGSLGRSGWRRLLLRNRYWIGRGILLGAAILATSLLLALLAFVGMGAHRLLVGWR